MSMIAKELAKQIDTMIDYDVPTKEGHHVFNAYRLHTALLATRHSAAVNLNDRLEQIAESLEGEIVLSCEQYACWGDRPVRDFLQFVHTKARIDEIKSESADSPEQPTEPAGLELNTFDSSGEITGSREVELTPDQVTEIINRSAQLIQTLRGISASTASINTFDQAVDDLEDALQKGKVLEPDENRMPCLGLLP
ncbi:hypothetical protein [Neptuniibacter sp. QD37_11]|uniref:hypothetical protein n=1 Tax=Neptuniibacter sp. QD37_11 TaxID=3398209 RepID=UPI0039F49C29